MPVTYPAHAIRKRAPSTGPHTVPTNHIRLTTAVHFARSLNTNKSVKTTDVIVSIPPPPAPWIARPASKAPMGGARAQTIVPIVNSVMARRIIGRLPKALEKAAKRGWQTAELSRKAVPVQ